MFKFITNMFTKKPEAPVAETPYKVEAPVTAPKAKKPAVKKTTTAKPRKPKAPKA
jgi:hypothetical protein